MDDTLIGVCFNAKQKVAFSPIDRHPELLTEFEEWNSEYEKKVNNSQYEISSVIYLDDIIIPEIQEFQRM